MTDEQYGDQASRVDDAFKKSVRLIEAECSKLPEFNVTPLLIALMDRFLQEPWNYLSSAATTGAHLNSTWGFFPAKPIS